MKKILFVVTLFLFIIIFSCCFIHSSLFKERTIYEYLNNTWDISISEESKVLYEFEDFGGFHGDGFRYVVFDLKQNDLDKLINDEAGDESQLFKKNDGIEKYLSGHIYRAYYNHNIPIEFRMDESITNYYYKYIIHSSRAGTTLDVLIDIDVNRLYIFVLVQ